MHPWDGSIARLRSRLVFNGVVNSLSRVIVPGAVLGVLVIAVGRRSPWVHFLTPYAGAALGVLCLAAVVVGATRTRPSRVFLAKMIDLESRLADRLASAVAFAELPERTPFEQQCIEHVRLNVPHNFPLVVPRIRSPRSPLILASALVLAGATAVYAYRPRPVFETDATKSAQVDARVLESVLADVNRLSAGAAKNPALDQVTSAATEMVRALERGQLTRVEALAASERLRQDATAASRTNAALHDLASARIGGAAARLARGLETGDVAQVRAGLEELTATTASGTLGEDEQQAAVTALDALSSAIADHRELSDLVGRARQAVAQNNLKSASALLRSATARADEMTKPLGTLAAAKQAEKIVDRLDQALRGEADSGPEHVGVAAGRSGATAAGAQSAAHSPTESPGAVQGGAELQLHGQWNGKIIRQLFEAPGKAASDTEVEASRAIFVEHRRVVEERFQQDEIPLEYRDAVRAYFSALDRKESQWNQIRK